MQRRALPSFCLDLPSKHPSKPLSFLCCQRSISTKNASLGVYVFSTQAVRHTCSHCRVTIHHYHILQAETFPWGRIPFVLSGFPILHLRRYHPIPTSGYCTLPPAPPCWADYMRHSKIFLYFHFRSFITVSYLSDYG